MNVGYKTLVINSFALWLDDYILNKGQAYTNISSNLYQQSQDRHFPAKTIYNSPFKQWVYNYNVAGAIIPSGISGQNYVINRGQSGCMIDYQNGRILFSGGVTGNFSGTYSVKDFNIYVANDTQENIVMNTAYKYNPSFNDVYSGCEPYTKYLPGIFINLPRGTNDPFTLGGMDKNLQTISLTAITDNYNKTVNLLSLLEDASQLIFPLLYENDLPLNEYGDFKTTGLYNYATIRDAAVANGNPLIFIDDVTSSILSDKTIRARGELISFIGFDLCSYRYSRQYYN